MQETKTTISSVIPPIQQLTHPESSPIPSVSKQHPDPDEFLDVVALKPEEVKKMVLQEELFDAKSLAALLLYNYKAK